MSESVDIIAKAFFDSCELGKGWEVCKIYCSPNCEFEAQVATLEHIKTIEEYCEYLKGMFLTNYKNLTYEMKSWTTFNNQIIAYAVFKEISIDSNETVETDGNLLNNERKEEKSKNKVKLNTNPILYEYVYVIDVKDGKVCNMTKIENRSWAKKELGWK